MKKYEKIEAVLLQTVADTLVAAKTSNLNAFYNAMVANAEDATNALGLPNFLDDENEQALALKLTAMGVVFPEGFLEEHYGI